MTVPDYQTMMRPVLETLEADGAQSFRAIVEIVADRLRLTADDRAEMIESGQNVVSNRVGWAITYLVQAGAVRRPRRGVAEITDRGRQLLQRVEGPIGNEHLARFEEFQAFKRRTRTTSRTKAVDATDVAEPASVAVEQSSLSPRELIDSAAKSHRAAVTGDLLDRVMALSPTAYERLVLKLLGGMGYGASGRIESTAKSADAGIDGVISQDPLGLDRIYVQAKRYARDRSVGRPQMQEFVGAAAGRPLIDRGNNRLVAWQRLVGLLRHLHQHHDPRREADSARCVRTTAHRRRLHLPDLRLRRGLPGLGPDRHHQPVLLDDEDQGGAHQPTAHRGAGPSHCAAPGPASRSPSTRWAWARPSVRSQGLSPTSARSAVACEPQSGSPVARGTTTTSTPASLKGASCRPAAEESVTSVHRGGMTAQAWNGAWPIFAPWAST